VAFFWGISVEVGYLPRINMVFSGEAVKGNAFFQGNAEKASAFHIRYCEDGYFLAVREGNDLLFGSVRVRIFFVTWRILRLVGGGGDDFNRLGTFSRRLGAENCLCSETHWRESLCR
jgi:hypothetical protein